MATCRGATRPLTRCLHKSQSIGSSARSIRAFTVSIRNNEAVVAEAAPDAPVFDANTVTSKKGERTLMKEGVMPVGSRRRRAAVKSSENIPFEQLPYQCFQEARKVLMADREEKLKAIKLERFRINLLQSQTFEKDSKEQHLKETRLASMRRHLEYLKIQADINDPLIKKRFEDGDGDMNKPIYRYLADKKWRTYQRKIIVQRIQQLGIVPDALPHFEPTAEVRMAFGKRNVQPGDFVDSRVSEQPARLNVQVFDQGERLVTVVVIDGDVPDLENDSYTTRCHYLACNIPIGPTQTSLPLSHATEGQLAHSWLPPFAQKGSNYHRYSIFVLQQGQGKPIKINDAFMGRVKRHGFSLRTFAHRHNMEPIGVGIFRALWDEGTADVMTRAGIEGSDIEFRRKKIEALKPKQKARGWEARHASAKYESLRKGRGTLKRVVNKQSRGRKRGH